MKNANEDVPEATVITLSALPPDRLVFWNSLVLPDDEMSEITEIGRKTPGGRGKLCF